MTVLVSAITASADAIILNAPLTTTPYPFGLTIESEKLTVRGGSGTRTLYVDRGQGGTTAASHAAGVTVTSGWGSGGGGSISAAFVAMLFGQVAGEDFASALHLYDPNANVLADFPADMGLAWNAYGTGKQKIDATEAGVWVLSLYFSPTRDATAKVVCYLGTPNPSGGNALSLADVSADMSSIGTWGGAEASISDIVKLTVPTAEAIFVQAFTAGATAGGYKPILSGGLTIVRLS